MFMNSHQKGYFHPCLSFRWDRPGRCWWWHDAKGWPPFNRLLGLTCLEHIVFPVFFFSLHDWCCICDLFKIAMGRVASCIGEVCWQICTKNHHLISSWWPFVPLSVCPHDLMFLCLYWWCKQLMSSVAGGLVDQQRETERAWDSTPPQGGAANILLNCFEMARGTTKYVIQRF